MILNFQTIQIIAQLAVLIGEQIIPDIIKICHPNGTDQEQKDLAIQVQDLMKKKQYEESMAHADKTDDEHKEIVSTLIDQNLKI